MSEIEPTASGKSRKLSAGVMIAYGAGDIAQSIKNQGFNVLLLFFYQQLVGLPGTLTGLALAIALAFDAVTDPIAGGLSDRLKGRWGRRHPLIAMAAIPLAITFYLLFSPPENMSDTMGFLWLTTFAILVRGSMTFYHIPHLALGAEMAHDYHQRSTLFAFNAFIGTVFGALTSVVIYRVFFPTTPEFSPGLLNPAGYSSFALVGGAAMIIALLICVLGTFREIPHLREPEVTTRFSFMNLLGDMVEVFRDRNFVVVFAGSILVALIAAIEGVGQPFMGVHFWGLTTEQLSYGAIVALLAFALGFSIVPVVTRRFDKKPVLIGFGLVAVLVVNLPICLRLLDFAWFPENGSPWILTIYLAVIFVGATTLPVLGATYNSMYADLADAHELRTHRRREGAIYSTRAFANKATGALGLFIGGIILDVVAFPENASYGSVPDEIIWNLGFFVGPATSIFTLMGVAIFVLYRMDQAKHREIVSELIARRASLQKD
ncbi:MAG: MFS transporter [Proteobacteria bacterium]|jgi:GPH family glycoside/pentoside/hexuronide:cation symporter|nr:MFS transporter [Pseudomonadota bacterium]MDA1301804.1 MFS transporter [Pseudomonadota bacterium]